MKKRLEVIKVDTEEQCSSCLSVNFPSSRYDRNNNLVYIKIGGAIKNIVCLCNVCLAEVNKKSQEILDGDSSGK